MAKSLRDQLVGAWELIEYCAYLPGDESNKKFPMGPDAKGIIMYTPDGYMSAQLMRSQRTPFDHDDPHSADVDELAGAAAGYLTYAGPYSVVDDGLI